MNLVNLVTLLTLVMTTLALPVLPSTHQNLASTSSPHPRNIYERQPHALSRRIICEVDFPGEYPQKQTQALGVRQDVGDKKGPCRESEEE
ncbi:hypothetical protein BDY19DRAFT_192383 [Irpex rosettiformis]|uniref:Uncharacterized protein n=1 Tax=Irpex rosettiformis TaxID=378272 RepID=A0ACB8U270_9APHY|nr:hypothetical protein BDY19DRAFT_192383 [Irpex rosettiformis]